MAKKVVATLKKTDQKGYVKVIKTIRSPKTGAYAFREEILPEDLAKDYFKS
jgi:hypothetical protein